MSKFIAKVAVVAALMAAPALAAAPAPAAPVRLDISSVDFSNREQVAAFNGRVEQLLMQMCKRESNKVCREQMMFKINAQLNDSQRAALKAASASETASAR